MSKLKNWKVVRLKVWPNGHIHGYRSGSPNLKALAQFWSQIQLLKVYTGFMQNQEARCKRKASIYEKWWTPLLFPPSFCTFASVKMICLKWFSRNLEKEMENLSRAHFSSIAKTETRPSKFAKFRYLGATWILAWIKLGILLGSNLETLRWNSLLLMDSSMTSLIQLPKFQHG